MPSDEAIGIFLAERDQRAMDTEICAFLGLDWAKSQVKSKEAHIDTIRSRREDAVIRIRRNIASIQVIVCTRPSYMSALLRRESSMACK